MSHIKPNEEVLMKSMAPEFFAVHEALFELRLQKLPQAIDDAFSVDVVVLSDFANDDGQF